jgi:protease YdgD
MLRACSRGLLLVAAVSISTLTAANSATLGPMELHREAVDEQRYPWSSVGKLYNETGGFCSGAVISRDKILTAAHCLFNYRTQRFIPAQALHFLVGYRAGRYTAHARIVSYELGAGFDPLRYGSTSGADWAVLTVTERLPAEIEPLRLRQAVAPSGTRAVLVGYRQDRAFAMTADRDCELRESTGAGRRLLLLHTCRSSKGYSGAPILVSAGGAEVQVAGIQIASMQADGTQRMIAVPAQAILRQDRYEIDEPVVVADAAVGVTSEVCLVPHGDETTTLEAIQARLDLDRSGDRLAAVVSAPEPADGPAPHAIAWLAFEPFAVAIP